MCIYFASFSLKKIKMIVKYTYNQNKDTIL